MPQALCLLHANCQGEALLRPFVTEIGGCQTLWTAANIIDDQIARVREQVGSDEVILGLMEGREVLNVRYLQRKKLMDRFTGSAAESADRLLMRWWQRGQKPLM